MKNWKVFSAVSLSLAIALVGCQSAPSASESSVAETAAASEASTMETSETGVMQKEGALTVVAASDSIYDFATMIGGDKVQVVDLIEGLQEAHDWEPTPKLLGQVNEADLLLVSGAGMESWLPDVQKSLTGKVEVKDMSEGVKLMEGAAHTHDHDHDDHDKDDHDDHDDHDKDDHDHDHEHAAGGVDPHYWLGVHEAEKMAENVYHAIAKADPTNEKLYTDNWMKLKEKFQTLQKDYETKLGKNSGKTVIVPHEAFAYFFKDAGLKQLGLEGMLADGDPTAATIKNIVDVAKKDGIKTVFYEGYDDDKEEKAIASEIGGTTAPIYTLEMISPEDRQAGENYFTLMEKNIDAIAQSFAK